jgi:hypothetical protein
MSFIHAFVDLGTAFLKVRLAFLTLSDAPFRDDSARFELTSAIVKLTHALALSIHARLGLTRARLELTPARLTLGSAGQPPIHGSLSRDTRILDHKTTAPSQAYPPLAKNRPTPWQNGARSSPSYLGTSKRHPTRNPACVPMPRRPQTRRQVS